MSASKKKSSPSILDWNLCALAVRPPEGKVVESIGIAWTEQAESVMTAIESAFNQNSRYREWSLPTTSLYAAMQLHFPTATFIERNLGLPHPSSRKFDGPPRPFMYLDPEDGVDLVEEAAIAFKNWVNHEFMLWAGRVNLSDTHIRRIKEQASHAFSGSSYSLDISQKLAGNINDFILKHRVLQFVRKKLEGLELFDTKGPVYGIVRCNSMDNGCELMTWPIEYESYRTYYSMLATISFETVPFFDRPIIRIKAGKRLWRHDLPRSTYGRNTVSGYYMGRGSTSALHFNALGSDKKLKLPFDSSLFLKQKMNLWDDVNDLAEAVERGPTNDSFLGLVYGSSDGRRYFRDKKDNTTRRYIGFGAAAADHLHLYQKVADVLKDDGFEPIPLSEATQTFRITGAKLTTQDYFMNLYGEEKPTLVVFALTEKERVQIKEAANSHFGDAFNIVLKELPPGAHGPADKSLTEEQRFTRQLGLWSPIAESLAQNYKHCHVLVQARDEFQTEEGKTVRDDPVNKVAARHAFATRGKANVQYLLPDDESWDHRAKAALLDVSVAHAGIISEKTTQVIKKWGYSRVIGISLVTQNKASKFASGGSLFVAGKIDAETGKTYGRIGWIENKDLKLSDWEDYSLVLQRVAATDHTRWRSCNSKDHLYEKFVRSILEEASSQDGRSLAMIEPNRHLKSLADPNLGKESLLGDDLVALPRLPGVTVVRVKQGAPRLIVNKTEFDKDGNKKDEYATVQKGVFKLSDNNQGLSSYLITWSYPSQSRPKRGASVYRNLRGKLDGNNQSLFQVTEVTGVHLQEGDEMAQIANLVLCLKGDYVHTEDKSALPQPLFFESKIKDYMCPYITAMMRKQSSGLTLEN